MVRRGLNCWMHVLWLPATHVYSGGDLQPYEPVWLVLHIAGGQVGLPALVLTFVLSRRLQIHPTLVNFCITWVRKFWH